MPDETFGPLRLSEKVLAKSKINVIVQPLPMDTPVYILPIPIIYWPVLNVRGAIARPDRSTLPRITPLRSMTTTWPDDSQRRPAGHTHDVQNGHHQGPLAYLTVPRHRC